MCRTGTTWLGRTIQGMMALYKDNYNTTIRTYSKSVPGECCAKVLELQHLNGNTYSHSLKLDFRHALSHVSKDCRLTHLNSFDYSNPCPNVTNYTELRTCFSRLCNPSLPLDAVGRKNQEYVRVVAFCCF